MPPRKKPAYKKRVHPRVKNPRADANGGPKRSADQWEMDLADIAKLRLQGFSYRAIMEQMALIRPYTLSLQTVHNDMAEVTRRWQVESVNAISEHKAQLLASLLYQEAQLWEQWEASKKPLGKQNVTEDGTLRTDDKGTQTAGKIKKIKKSIEKRDRLGNPAYMKLILDIQAAKAKLLGVNAPERIVHSSGADGQPMPTATTTPTIIFNLPAGSYDPFQLGHAVEPPP